MERTKGIRLTVIRNEPEADENINIGLMKELTGNDKIIARGLYKEPVEFDHNTSFYLCVKIYQIFHQMMMIHGVV